MTPDEKMKQLEMVKLMVEKGADIKATTSKGV